MTLTPQTLSEMSTAYAIPTNDMLLIALNLYGVKYSKDRERLRFRTRFGPHHEDCFFTNVAVRKSETPFTLDGSSLLLGGSSVAEIQTIERDDVLMSYFRNQQSVLTLNSNARSHCTGCVFCYTTLETAADPKIKLYDEIDQHLSLVEENCGWRDLSHLEKVGVCTGCFREERFAIEHLAIVRKALTAHNCTAPIHFLSSVIRSRDAMKEIADRVGRFHLTVTIECFSRRSLLLKESKASLTVEAAAELMHIANTAGFEVDFTYIVGLDSLEVMKQNLPRLSDAVNTFPRFQVFQIHNDYMAGYAAPGATQLAFFAEARQYIESLFVQTKHRPKSWENYRPLWYYGFAGEPLGGVRI